MKKTTLAILLSSIMCASSAYADMIIEGENVNIGNGIEGKQPDAEGYYHIPADIQIGARGNYFLPDPAVGKVIINNGTKLKTGEIHVGNHGSGDGTLIIDGAGTKVEIVNNRLNVGSSGSKGKLYVRNGAELIQSNAPHDDNYFGYRGGVGMISVEGKGSKIVMNLGQQGVYAGTDASNIYLRDGGALEINDRSATLDYVVNEGYLSSQKTLGIDTYLQFGDDTGTKGGAFNLPEGLRLYSGTLVVKKLAEPNATLLLKRCDSCTIVYDADEALELIYDEHYRIKPNLVINKGKVSLDQQAFDAFHATDLTIHKNTTFSLANVETTAPDAAAQRQNEVYVDNLTHLGTLELGDGSANPKFTVFTVQNYKGGGELIVDTVWNKDTDTSISDVLYIKGNVDESATTTVRTKSNILGDIELIDKEQFSPMVVQVDADHQGNLFVGKSETRNAGEAQLKREGNSYYWTLKAKLPTPVVPPSKPSDPAKPITPVEPETVDIISKSVVGYVQQPYINRKMGLDQLGKLHERVGEQRNAGWENGNAINQVWGRMNLDYTALQGRSRFGADVKSGFVQFGRDIDFKLNDDKSQQHTGLTFTYGWANSKFFDKYRAENGVVVADKFTGSAKSDMLSIGGYHTYYSPTGAYLDLVGQVSWLQNRYRSGNTQVKQNGYGLGASIEVGKPYHLLNPQVTIEPQAQLSYQSIWLNGFNDGIRQVKKSRQDSLVGRLGVRVNWSETLDKNSPQVYFTANLIQTLTGKGSTITVGREQVKERFGDLAAEFGLGGQYPISQNLSVYADARYVIGIQDRNRVHRDSSLSRCSYHGRIGLRYSW